MAPFSIHATGIHGIKDKIESMAVHGCVIQRAPLYFSLTLGQVIVCSWVLVEEIYICMPSAKKMVCFPFICPFILLKIIAEGKPDVTLLETKKGFSRRSIDQLGFIKDTNSLVVLSGVQHTFYLYHSDLN